MLSALGVYLGPQAVKREQEGSIYNLTGSVFEGNRPLVDRGPETLLQDPGGS